MAFLDETGVQNLTAQIKTLANATYAPLSHTHPSTDISGLTDEKLSTTEASNGTYFPVLGEATSVAETKKYSPNLSFSIDSNLTDLKISSVSSDAVGIRFSGLNGVGTIRATSSLTTVSTYDLPNASGTLALTSNIPAPGTTASTISSTSSSGGTATSYSKSDHVHSISGTTITNALGYTPSPTDNKVAQNNSTAANDFRVLLSSSTSDSSQTAEANKSAGLRFMPSTNHLYVGSAGQDALITVSPRMHLGVYTRYTQTGEAESSTSYGVGIGIDNALAYNSYLTTSALTFQHWNASRPSGGVPSSTNYVDSMCSTSNAHVLLRDYSGKDALKTESELTSALLTFINSAGNEYTVGPTKISNWDSHITNGNYSLTAATTQAVYPIKIDSRGHISAYGSAVTNIVQTTATQTLTNKSLTAPSLSNPVVGGNLKFDSDGTSDSHMRLIHRSIAANATLTYTRVSGATYVIFICAASATNSGLYLVHGSNTKAISASSMTTITTGSTTGLSIKCTSSAQIYMFRLDHT